MDKINFITEIDFLILDWIAQNMRCAFLDFIMPVLTSLANAGIIWIILAAVLLIIPKTRKLGVVLSIALVCDLLLCNVLLKPLVHRIRPYDLKEGIELIIKKPHDYSFPSGHSAASFTSAFALLFIGAEKRYWIPSMVLSVIIAFSRLYLYVHYPTDVIAGLFIGLLCGFIGAIIVKTIIKYRKKKTDKKQG